MATASRISAVFYDKLHCPVGFGSSTAACCGRQPRPHFLKDTDGDDKADVVVQLYDGWATEDTHTINAFEFNRRLLRMLEASP